jgi:competence protein ComGC
MVEVSSSMPLLKRSKKVLIIVSVVLAVVIILGVLIVSLPSLTKTANSPQSTVNSAKVEITSTNLRILPIEEHLAYVDVGLYNKEGAGTVEVWATISDGVNGLTRNETIYFNGVESRNLTLTFSEVSFSNISDVREYTWIAIPQTDSDKYQVMP